MLGLIRSMVALAVLYTAYDLLSAPEKAMRRIDEIIRRPTPLFFN